ncbi:Os02g0701300, partial [Oryza sativa Japonica Group]
STITKDRGVCLRCERARARERLREREGRDGDAVCLPVSGGGRPPLVPGSRDRLPPPLLPLHPALRGRWWRRDGGGRADDREVAAGGGGEAAAVHRGAVRGAGAAGAHIQVPGGRRARPAGSRAPHPPRTRLPRRPLLQPSRPWIWSVLRQEAGPRARAVPAYGRQEMAVLEGGRAGFQVLRAPHAPRPQPFKKACGNAAGRPVPTALICCRFCGGAPCCCLQWQQLPKPLSLPCYCRQQWRGRGEEHAQLIWLGVGFSAAHG